MTDIFKIKSLLDDTSRDLTQVLPTEELRGIVIYFLEALESEAEDRKEFEQMLLDLLDDIDRRLDSGKW